ncbi:hypothetical protein HY734_03240 [Candidatus Uhrbacteria bacterium]|nr:hypothetical protein [Candidatus Uhrbacteria bacterium]
MWTQRDHFDPREAVARTAFFASLASLVTAICLEWAWPGFVSNHLPFHVFFLPLLASGVWWGALPWQTDGPHGRPWLQVVAALFLSGTAVAVAWSLRGAFDGYVLLVAGLLALVPFLVLSALRSE